MENQLSNNFSLSKATVQVKTLKQDMGQSVIALGKWLLLVKENLPKGEWMNWLKHEVQIPYVQAWRFMKVSQEVDYKTLEKVGYRKMVEILELPQSKFREELIELAPSLKRTEIEALKNGYSHGDNEETNASDIVDAVTPATADVDTALDANATLLDALNRIVPEEVTKNYLEFLKRQLKTTPQMVEEFLKKI